MISHEQVFVTDNLKLAAALTAAGFSIRNATNVIDIKGRERIVCELDDEHNGVKSVYLKSAFENKIDLISRVNEIIRVRGITQEEYIVLAFDAASAGISNRSTIVFCLSRNRPLIAKDIGNGRALIYLDGTPKEQLVKFLNEIDK